MRPKQWSDSVQPLEDMRLNIVKAIGLLDGAPENWWEAEEMRRLAVLHIVQVVGEAARRVPGPVRDLAPRIPWVRIVGIRSFIVHEYDQLDPGILKDVVHNKFPLLLPELDGLLAAVKERGNGPLP